MPLSTSAPAALARIEQAGQIDPAGDLPRLRRDARDALRLPDVGEDLALHEFELVELLDRQAVVLHGHAAGLLERLRIEEAQRPAMPSLMMSRVPSCVSPQPSPV